MGLTGTRIILEISSSVGAVGVNLTYRWWTSDNDPWQAVVPGWLGANSGEWSPYSIGKQTILWGKDSEKYRTILQLNGVGGEGQPFKEKSKGSGQHFGVGGKIPAIPGPSGLEKRWKDLLSGLGLGAPIEWSVIAII